MTNFADNCALNNESHVYYMPKPVLGKSQRYDWIFLSRDFAVRTVSVETVQAVYFCFGANPAIHNLKQLYLKPKLRKKCEYCHSSQQNYEKKLKIDFFANFKDG